MKLVNLSDVNRTELKHAGKANNVYLTKSEEYLELEASDRISAGNGAKTDIISGKGVANNVISEVIFQKLEQQGIHTHYVGMVQMLHRKSSRRQSQYLLR